MDSLQQRAEAALGQRATQSPEQFAALAPEAAQRVLHDLQVHQIELEMQNEELRRTHAALDTSRAHYADFYDLAPVGYCTVSAKGLIREVNLATSALLNVPRSQLINRPISRFIFNDDQGIYYDFRHELGDTGKSLSCELRLLRRQGAPWWGNLLVSAVQDDDGGSELRIVLKDITERKQVETALRDSEERYRSLAEWTPEPILVHGAGKTLYVNPAAIKMFGATSASDLVGKPMLELIHPDFRKTVAERLNVNAEPGGSTPMLEQKLLKFDGSVIDVEVQGIQVNFGGKPAVQAAMRDVTERNKAEAFLRASLRLRVYGLSHSLDELLTQTLDEAELLTGSEIGFFHFLEADQKTLWLQDWSSRTLREMCTAEGKMQHYSVDQAGVWVDCIHERRPVIHNDYASLPHRKGLPAGHAPVKRELVVPIMRGELIVAILGVGNKPVNYDQRDVETVSRLADIAWDVVAARRVEHELEKSRNLLAETERIGKVGGWEFSIDTGKQAWTDEVYRIHEVAPDLGPTVEIGINFYAPDCRARVQEVVRRVIDHGEPFDIDSAIITAKGNRRDVHVVGRPDLEHRRIYGFIQDITERKNAQATLQRAANVFNHAREGVTVTDVEGSIIDVNAAFTRITGYSREDVLGQNPRILQSGRQTKEFYIAMWRDLLGAGNWSGEIWNKRKNGEIYPELLTISAVTDAQGSVKQYVGLFTDITVRKQAEDKVHHMAFFDPLTKLPNRRTLSDRLTQAMASSKRSGRFGALMVLDLDNFKPLNDAHGHAAGDLLLEAVAARMLACVREVDTVARIGGDEFVVLLSELDPDRTESIAQAELIAEKIRHALAMPYSLSVPRDGLEAAAVEHRCSASIGVVLYSNHDASQDELLRWADAAMYQAKAAGRNAIRFHGADGIT
ncbi:MAG: PAS domain S-box protein [Comamonadaceae bacterium]|nr:MAG: PAS domain S-box protein [Comamonadaceae bacterium]